MGRNLQIVFSHLPDGVTDEEYSEWYDAHLPEILSIPGFVSAQRFRLEPVVVEGEAPVGYRYLALYEVDRDPEALAAEMEKLSLGTADAYVERKHVDDSGPALPAWWSKVRFASWNCIALGERVTAKELGVQS